MLSVARHGIAICSVNSRAIFRGSIDLVTQGYNFTVMHCIQSLKKSLRNVIINIGERVFPKKTRLDFRDFFDLGGVVCN